MTMTAFNVQTSDIWCYAIHFVYTVNYNWPAVIEKRYLFSIVNC